MKRFPIGSIIAMGILCLGGCSGTGESLGLSPGEVRFEIVGLDQASLAAEAKVLAAGSSDGGRWPEVAT